MPDSRIRKAFNGKKRRIKSTEQAGKIHTDTAHSDLLNLDKDCSLLADKKRLGYRSSKSSYIARKDPKCREDGRFVYSDGRPKY